MSDAAYLARILPVVRTLWEATEGDLANIPDNYAEHLHHTYTDGDVSLVPLLPVLRGTEELEAQEIEEAIEMLCKVNPEDWPYADDITEVDAAALLGIYDEDATQDFDFVEDNLGTSVTVEKALRAILESVVGESIEKVRAKGGGYFHQGNKFGQAEDGTWEGAFTQGDADFDFEIFPSESGWTVTYRLTAEALDNLPPVPPEHLPEEERKQNYNRPRRTRGWK
jgi:hypothetical protein